MRESQPTAQQSRCGLEGVNRRVWIGGCGLEGVNRRVWIIYKGLWREAGLEADGGLRHVEASISLALRSSALRILTPPVPGSSSGQRWAV